MQLRSGDADGIHMRHARSMSAESPLLGTVASDPVGTLRRSGAEVEILSIARLRYHTLMIDFMSQPKKLAVQKAPDSCEATPRTPPDPCW